MFYYRNILICFLTLMGTSAFAEEAQTHRQPLFSNERVDVWQTTIHPDAQHSLKMHRHERDRVLVALTDGVLKVVNDRGESHDLILKKEQAYYLKKDVPGELHRDENMTSEPIKVLVIELK